MSKVTKTIRRVLYVIPLTMGYFSSMLFLSGCSANNPIIINSEEEFFNMENKYYKLGCDLDLYGKTWTPLKVKGFNGDGHTISGLMIGSTDYWYNDEGKVASIFLASKEIKNVIINRCNLVASEVETVSIVGMSVESYENVKVQKCTITSNYTISPKWHMLSAAFLNSCRGPHYCSKIINCSVTDCTLTFKNTSYDDCLISGLDDGVNEGQKNRTIENCSVTNCSFDVSSSTSYSNVSFGGICGMLPEAMVDDALKLNNLKVDNCNVKVSAKTAQVGGVIGKNYNYVYTSAFKSNEAKNIVSSNNTFDVATDTDVTFGGVAGSYYGTLNNVLSKNNSATLRNNNKGKLYVGGALGYGAIDSKYVISDNNELSIVNLKTTDNKNTYIGGLVGKQNGSIINSFISFKYYPSNFNQISQVCPSVSLIKNVYIFNGMDTAGTDYTELENKEDCINALSLGSEWSISDGEVCLSF